jgi:hypothetical protein
METRNQSNERPQSIAYHLMEAQRMAGIQMRGRMGMGMGMAMEWPLQRRGFASSQGGWCAQKFVSITMGLIKLHFQLLLLQAEGKGKAAETMRCGGV